MRIIKENKILISVLCLTCLVVVAALHLDVKKGQQNIIERPVSPVHTLKITDEPVESLILDTGETINAEAVVEESVDEDPVSAGSYLVGNLVTGEIYIQKNIDMRSPIASISKLFTVLTSEAIIASTTIINITEEMVEPYGTTTGIVAGAKFTASDLKYPLLLESSNDGAQALALFQGYDEFIGYMNGFASEIGLQSTSFTDPSGLGAHNVSSARDLFTFARYLYKDRPDILELSHLEEYALDIATTTSDTASSTTKHIYKNTNVFINDPNFIGGKTGRTEAARETMLSLFKYDISGVSYPIAVIVLKSDFSRRQVDSAILIRSFLDQHVSKN